MFRMVKLAEADHLLQRILWRDSPNQPAKTYELTTTTHRTATALYLVTKCLQRLATEGEVSLPIAAKVVHKDSYVDDLLTGTDSLEDGKALATDLILLINCSGFILRKWSSNSSELLSTILAELRYKHSTLELDSWTSVVETLGLTWESAEDIFKIAVPCWSSESTITKRVVLSNTARIFDTLGLISPINVQANNPSIHHRSC